MHNVLRKYPLTSYYAFACGIVLLVVSYWQIGAMVYENIHGKPFDLYGLVYETYDKLGYEYINLVGTLHIFVNFPWLTPAILFGLAPTIAAIILISLTSGKDGLKGLFRRLRPFAPGTRRSRVIRCYGMIVLGTLILYPIFLAVQSSFADAEAVERSRSILGVYAPVSMLFAFLMGAFLDEGGLLEELGWRGFALPLLLQRMDPLRATIAVGALWAAWHLPREVVLLISGDSTIGYFILKQVEFMSSGISVSIIITYFFALAGGSVVPAIMVHGLANFFSKTFFYDGMPSYLETLRFQTFVELVIAVGIVVLTRGRLGVKSGETLDKRAQPVHE